MSIFKAIAAACNAYSAYVSWKQRVYLYSIQDEMDRAAADGSPAAKLRLERLAQRERLERNKFSNL